MHDLANGQLLDVREDSLEDLIRSDNSALDGALERILASDATRSFNSFNSSI